MKLLREQTQFLQDFMIPRASGRQGGAKEGTGAACPSPCSGLLLSTCEHQSLQDVGQRHNALDHIILIHHHQTVNLEQSTKKNVSANLS